MIRKSARLLPAVALSLVALPAAAERLRCDFDRVCAPDGCRSTSYELRIEWDGEDGRFTDGAGRSGDVTVAEMEAFWHFIEIMDRGDLVMTSVADGGVAVHSKHALLGGELKPTQYYGACRRGEG
ncbi:hypothetical protein P2H44_08375 [Albimonas sp. CAU 1670]|uniref:hypothetical protein n=1 Tax=Albimonas sp. CAU 1670 TaxID=3032599 RepID=UPI0023DB9473|nr:hypothetical protein [Albimonas sp. CAU 1670]MDF2232564.1 hypothetical protein [Albimonas sp. CAU 1670]